MSLLSVFSSEHGYGYSRHQTRASLVHSEVRSWQNRYIDLTCYSVQPITAERRVRRNVWKMEVIIMIPIVIESGRLIEKSETCKRHEDCCFASCNNDGICDNDDHHG